MNYNLIMKFMIFAILVVTGSASFACLESAQHISKNSFGKYFETKDFQFSPAFNNFCSDAKLQGTFDKLPARDLIVAKPISKFNLVIEDQDEVFKKISKQKLKELKNYL